MSSELIARIFFFYGLAFFCMGLAILLELGRISDPRLKNALRMLTFFGLLHGSHEWVEMFQGMDLLPYQLTEPLAWQGLRIAVLAISFLGLAGFGISLLMDNERTRRRMWVPVLLMALFWMAGLLVIRSRYLDFWGVADVWTRYALAVPAALLAAAALISLRITFREAGMARFGRDSLFAALALATYGVIGQTFTNPSALPPSTVINSDLFYELFGFPVQLFRAVMAILATIFVVRFLRAFEVERQQRLAKLQADHLAHLEDLTGHALDELQRLIAGLRPSHLDDLGLAAALRWYAGEGGERAPVNIRVEVEGDEQSMSGLIKVGLFRVAQEALTNVIKHAGADEAVVRVRYREDQVQLEVADDGIGCDVPGADRPSWGLIGMQERVALMGGEFDLSSEKGQGTRITVTVPLDAQLAEEHEHAIATG